MIREKADAFRAPDSRVFEDRREHEHVYSIADTACAGIVIGKKRDGWAEPRYGVRAFDRERQGVPVDTDRTVFVQRAGILAGDLQRGGKRVECDITHGDHFAEINPRQKLRALHLQVVGRAAAGIIPIRGRSVPKCLRRYRTRVSDYKIGPLLRSRINEMTLAVRGRSRALARTGRRTMFDEYSSERKPSSRPQSASISDGA